MKTIAVIVLIYGLLLAGGGVMGYVQASSHISLITGLVFGAISIACAIAMLMGKRSAAWIALVVTFFLDGFFTYRYIKTQSFMPAGLMSLVSLVVLVLLALSIRGTAKK